jgi:hypothetical protein
VERVVKERQYIEDDIVRPSCLKRLEYWKSVGVVIDFDDVHDLGKKCHRGRFTMRTKPGKRDIIAFFKVNGILWVYLIECKSPNGRWEDTQKAYAAKFFGLNNVIYEVVRDPKQIDKTIELASRFYKNSLEEADKLMGVL